MKNLIAFMISSALAFSVHGEEKPINDSPIDKYEKEQQVMRSCVKAGGTPSASTEKNGCSYVACIYPKSENNCVHLVGHPKGVNCTPGLCK